MLSAFLEEVFSPSDHPSVECLEALHRVVVGVFGQILDPEFENDKNLLEEMFTGTIQIRYLRITPKVHVLVHHVSEYVRRTGVQLGPTSEQTPKSQHTFFNIFYHRFKVNCTNYLVFREHLLKAALHYN